MTQGPISIATQKVIEKIDAHILNSAMYSEDRDKVGRTKRFSESAAFNEYPVRSFARARLTNSNSYE